MGLRSLILVLFLITLGHTFNPDPRCEAKAEWKVTNVWNLFTIEVWISEDPKIMDLIMTSARDEVLFKDELTVFKDYYVINGRREKNNPQPKTKFTDMEMGWATFRFDITDRYCLSYLSGEDNLCMLGEDARPTMKVTSVAIKGSNVTIDCPIGKNKYPNGPKNDYHYWNITDDTKVVPVGQHHFHMLIFYSHGHMMPSVSIGSELIPLRWDGNKVTSNHNDDPLPPFTFHMIELFCTAHTSTCKIFQQSVNGPIIGTMTMTSPILPSFITIHKGSADPFQLIISNGNSDSSNKGDQDIPNPAKSPFLVHCSGGTCSIV